MNGSVIKHNKKMSYSQKPKVPLIKNAFIENKKTKSALADFIIHTEKLSMGEQCLAFEKAFALKQGRREGILFNSGASANLAMFQALKNLGRLKNGDAVGFSALTWSTNIMPIIQMGLKPIAIDCDINTLNVMSHNIEERLAQVKLNAFFVTNVIGFAGNLHKIKEICAKNNILLIEDNCESLGTELHQGKTGNFGLGSSFSFYVAHHMSTIEGGMVCTNDSEFAGMLRITRANGWDRNLNTEQQIKWRKKCQIDEFEAKFTFYDLAFNFRPTEITGFLGLYQLQFLDKNIKTRENNFLQIEKIIKQNNDLILLERNHITTLSSFSIPVVCKNRVLHDKYVARFIDAGIEIRPMIAGNMQKQPFYKKYVKKIFPLPNTDFLHANSFYCGNCPDYTKKELAIIISCLENKK